MPDPRYPDYAGDLSGYICLVTETQCIALLFLVNNALARTLKRLNIMLTPVGDAIEHRGMRTPYVVVDLRESERRMKQKLAVFRSWNVKVSPMSSILNLSKNAELKFG